jgi:hypothetical protein
MKSNALFSMLALLAAAISTPLIAGDGERAAGGDAEHDCPHATDMRARDGFDHGMQVVSHDASPDTPGYGWRYFADSKARRAVVISPEGNYYYSQGKGLRWIAAEQR